MVRRCCPGAFFEFWGNVCASWMWLCSLEGGSRKEIDGFRRRGFHQGEVENVVIG